MTKRSHYILALLILAYCFLNSLDMVHAWRNAPYEQFSWLIFLVWCLPLMYYWIGKSDKMTNETPLNSILLWGALSASLLGTLGSLNAVKYVGLAFALASFIPWNPILFVWIAGAISWMPVVGWVGSHYFPGYVFGMRLVIALVTSGLVLWYLRSHE